MKKFHILIACEFSGIVRDAFIRHGHNAVSCDLLPCESEVCAVHYQGNVFDIINDGWDMMIAFPPCTHLSSSGAQYWPEKQKNGKQQEAINFFMKLYNANIEKICIENSVGIMSIIFKKPTQIIHPYHFGDPYLKKTCLWMKNLPLLNFTTVVKPIAHWHSGSVRGGLKKDKTRTPSKLPTMLKHGSKERSRFFAGIAEAMATQWGRT